MESHAYLALIDHVLPALYMAVGVVVVVGKSLRDETEDEKNIRLHVHNKLKLPQTSSLLVVLMG